MRLAMLLATVPIAHGAYRAPQPPSLPPIVLPRSPVLSHGAAPQLQYKYVWQPGFIGAGSDVEPPALMTVSDALSECDADARCRGITYEGSNTTKDKKHIYFKMDDGVEKATGWSAWVKHAPVTPPALTVAVGGSSRLELRLREVSPTGSKDVYSLSSHVRPRHVCFC